jgi:hypothetical protein
VRAVIAPHNTGRRKEQGRVEEERGCGNMSWSERASEPWLQMHNAATRVICLPTPMPIEHMKECGPKCEHLVLLPKMVEICLVL